ncbi:MAG: hypothetical protein R3E83_22260 [Burkholderiaceae bacterium]
MSGFSADWLALREPHDHRARAIATFGSVPARDREPADLARSAPLCLVDLGCGNGSNLRYLAPRLGGHQHWRLLDNDPRLLADLHTRLNAWAGALQARFHATAADTFEIHAPGFRLTATTQCVDLSAGAGVLALRPGECVTASALLDLVSQRWLDTLIDACVAGGHPLLWALSYDGRLEWMPDDPVDDLIHTRFDHHQRGDKGFGAALGPEAARHAIDRLAVHAHSLLVRRSDWLLAPHDTAIQHALLDDWTAAVMQIAAQNCRDIEAWSLRRRALIDAGQSQLRVGHLDLAANFSR